MERSSFASASSGELAAAAVSGLGRPVRVIPLRHPLDTSARGAASSSASAPSLLSVAMERARGMGPWEWAETALPCLAWMRSYRWKEDLQADLAAGITVGVMLVPQVRSDLILL
jgi:sulfate transporter 4